MPFSSPQNEIEKEKRKGGGKVEESIRGGRGRGSYSL